MLILPLNYFFCWYCDIEQYTPGVSSYRRCTQPITFPSFSRATRPFAESHRSIHVPTSLTSFAACRHSSGGIGGYAHYRPRFSDVRQSQCDTFPFFPATARQRRFTRVLCTPGQPIAAVRSHHNLSLYSRPP